MALREHPIERRARLLTQRLQQTVKTTSDEINPPGRRPPLHNQVSPRAALAWWMAHRYDDLGQQWLEKVGATPPQVAQLDAWLYHASQAVNPQAQPGAPGAPAAPLAPVSMPNPNRIIENATRRELQNEGPEVGAEDA